MAKDPGAGDTTTIRPIALGCMRLSTDPDRDDERSVAVLHAAFDAGATLLDTADAYALNQQEAGHNERLIARAIAAWPGDRSRITVATKGGIVRPDGRWQPDGRAKHLHAACEASCKALGVSRIPLYQLHVPDPRIPLSTSMKALGGLQRAGLIEHIGLCNVTVGQIEEARRLADIASIQVELGIWNDAAILGGVVAYCIANRLQLLAYRPLGGRRLLPRTRNHPTLQRIAAAHGVTPFEIALARLCNLPGMIVPLPGATRIDTAVASVQAQRIALTESDQAALDEAFPAARVGRSDGASATQKPQRADAEVVIVMGLPGAGKTTLTSSLVAGGYRRLNRDETGGTLRELTADLDRALEDGSSRVVLDNTYVTRRSRAAVVQAASRHRVPVRCLWLTTSIDDAQVNAVSRLIARYGRLPADDDLSELRRTDVTAFVPTVQFRYQREMEPPDINEGFSSIEVVPFVREPFAGHDRKAVIVWIDDVTFDAEFVARLAAYRDAGYEVLGLSWQPGLSDGTRSLDDVQALVSRISAQAGFAIDVHYCPHPAGPPRCWCRKPLPGLGVLVIHRHRLDPARCIYVGSAAVDPGFARKLGFAHHTPASLPPI